MRAGPKEANWFKEDKGTTRENLPRLGFVAVGTTMGMRRFAWVHLRGSRPERLCRCQSTDANHGRKSSFCGALAGMRPR